MEKFKKDLLYDLNEFEEICDPGSHRAFLIAIKVLIRKQLVEQIDPQTLNTATLLTELEKAIALRSDSDPVKERKMKEILRGLLEFLVSLIQGKLGV